MPHISPLEKALDLIFKEMEKQGLVTEGMQANKGKIFEMLKEELGEKFDLDDLKSNKTLQKKLMGAMISAFLGVKNEFLDELKKDTPKNDPELNKKLNKKLEMALKLILLMQKLPKGKMDSQTAAKKMLDEFLSASKITLTQNEKNILEEQLKQALQGLFGGDDPRMVGENPAVVQHVVGNLFGFTNQSAADPNSQAYMVDIITYNSGKSDSLGLENIAKIADETIGLVMDGMENISMAPKFTQSKL